MVKELFKFKSSKGQSVDMSVEPNGFKIEDKGAFEGYLKGIVDFIQITGYKTAKIARPAQSYKEKSVETKSDKVAKQVVKSVQMVDPKLTAVKPTAESEPEEQEEANEEAA